MRRKDSLKAAGLQLDFTAVLAAAQVVVGGSARLDLEQQVLRLSPVIDLELVDLPAQRVDRLEVLLFLSSQQLLEVSALVKVLAASLEQLFSILITRATWRTRSGSALCSLQTCRSISREELSFWSRSSRD